MDVLEAKAQVRARPRTKQGQRSALVGPREKGPVQTCPLAVNAKGKYVGPTNARFVCPLAIAMTRVHKSETLRCVAFAPGSRQDLGNLGSDLVSVKKGVAGSKSNLLALGFD